jgi:hypothetical protein
VSTDAGDERTQVTDNSPQTNVEGSLEGKVKAQKELAEKLKVQWKLLWSERFDDKVRAEGVSINDYTFLRVERGTIIHATRDFKALSFREILEQHMVENPDRFIQPDVNSGGWSKFVKTKITNNSRQRSERTLLITSKKQAAVGQAKKGGRGWLHST